MSRLFIELYLDVMNEAISKARLAEKLHTSRSQVDWSLDPNNTSISLESLDRLAGAVGRQLKIELA